MTTRIWNVSAITPDTSSIPGLDSDKAIVLEGHKHSVSTIGWYKTPGTEREFIAT